MMDGWLAARLAAVASLGAALIHFAVVPAHWQEWPPAGPVLCRNRALSTDLGAGGARSDHSAGARRRNHRQCRSPRALGRFTNCGSTVRPSRRGTRSGARRRPLRPAAPDRCRDGGRWVWYRGRQKEPIPAFANAIILVGAVAVIALASTVGVASGLRHGDHGPTGAEPRHHGRVGHAGGHHSKPDPAAVPPKSRARRARGTGPSSPAGADAFTRLHGDHQITGDVDGEDVRE